MSNFITSSRRLFRGRVSGFSVTTNLAPPIWKGTSQRKPLKLPSCDERELRSHASHVSRPCKPDRPESARGEGGRERWERMREGLAATRGGTRNEQRRHAVNRNEQQRHHRMSSSAGMSSSAWKEQQREERAAACEERSGRVKSSRAVARGEEQRPVESAQRHVKWAVERAAASRKSMITGVSQHHIQCVRCGARDTNTCTAVLASHAMSLLSGCVCPCAERAVRCERRKASERRVRSETTYQSRGIHASALAMCRCCM